MHSSKSNCRPDPRLGRVPRNRGHCEARRQRNRVDPQARPQRGGEAGHLAEADEPAPVREQEEASGFLDTAPAARQRVVSRAARPGAVARVSHPLTPSLDTFRDSCQAPIEWGRYAYAYSPGRSPLPVQASRQAWSSRASALRLLLDDFFRPTIRRRSQRRAWAHASTGCRCIRAAGLERAETARRCREEWSGQGSAFVIASCSSFSMPSPPPHRSLCR